MGRCVHLFTDFGIGSLYVGQLHPLLRGRGVTPLHLLHDAPRFNPRAASYLLAALLSALADESARWRSPKELAMGRRNNSPR